jgi:hypothetical protein
VGEKWQVMGWNMVRMATDCGAELNPLEYVYVARRWFSCFWGPLFARGRSFGFSFGRNSGVLIGGDPHQNSVVQVIWFLRRINRI